MGYSRADGAATTQAVNPATVQTIVTAPVQHASTSNAVQKVKLPPNIQISRPAASHPVSIQPVTVVSQVTNAAQQSIQPATAAQLPQQQNPQPPQQQNPQPLQQQQMAKKPLSITVGSCAPAISVSVYSHLSVSMTLWFQKELMVEAQEMFRNSNKVSRPEKALILGFMAGSRGNQCLLVLTVFADWAGHMFCL